MSDPAPFHIHRQDDGACVASDGKRRVFVPDTDANVRRRRAIKGIAAKAAADGVLPQLNQFAGELLKHPETPAEEIVARLHAIAKTINIQPPKRVEWLAVTLDQVNVYIEGDDVVITRRDLSP